MITDSSVTTPRPLLRSITDSRLGGVPGRLRHYSNVDPLLFRVAFAVTAALWNHNAGRLFRRTRTYVERELARQVGVTQKVARAEVRVSYVKVAEFQRRGVVHFHTLWRLDSAGAELAPPAERYDAQLLADAIMAALPSRRWRQRTLTPSRTAGDASMTSGRCSSAAMHLRQCEWPATSPSTRRNRPRRSAA